MLVFLYHFSLPSQAIKVLGLDLDLQKVELINSGKSYLKYFSSESIAEQVNANRLEATIDPSRLSEVEAILICVPTPLDDHREPDLTFIIETARTIAPHLPMGVLITLESTTYPGTTEDELRMVLEEGSGMKAGIDFHLAYSPEREDPGREDASVKTSLKWQVGLPPNVGILLKPYMDRHWTKFIEFLLAKLQKLPSSWKIFSVA